MLRYRLEGIVCTIRAYLYRYAAPAVALAAYALCETLYWGCGAAWIMEAGRWMAMGALLLAWLMIGILEALRRHPRTSPFWTIAVQHYYPQSCRKFCLTGQWMLLAGGAAWVLMPRSTAGMAIWLFGFACGTLWAIWGLWLYARLMYWDRR